MPAQAAAWPRSRAGSRTGFNSFSGWVNKLASPTTCESPNNRASPEAFWPSTLDKECNRAARILRSFCSELCLITVSVLIGFTALRSQDENHQPYILL